MGSHNLMTVTGSGRALDELGSRRVEDLVGAAQLGVLLAQPAQFLRLGGGGARSVLPAFGFVLRIQVRIALRWIPKLTRDVGDRPARLLPSVTATDSARSFSSGGVLAWCCHRMLPPWSTWDQVQRAPGKGGRRPNSAGWPAVARPYPARRRVAP
jgi:hypothetical protein